MGALAWKIAEPAPAERRHEQRFKVRLLGQFMRSDRKEFDCEANGVRFSFQSIDLAFSVSYP